MSLPLGSPFDVQSHDSSPEMFVLPFYYTLLPLNVKRSANLGTNDDDEPVLAMRYAKTRN